MAHRVLLLEQHGSTCRDEQRGMRPMFCLLSIIHLDLTPQILPLPDWDFSVSFRISTPRFWKTRDDVTGSYFNPQFEVCVYLTPFAGRQHAVSPLNTRGWVFCVIGAVAQTVPYNIFRTDSAPDLVFEPWVVPASPLLSKQQSTYGFFIGMRQGARFDRTKSTCCRLGSVLNFNLGLQ